VRRFRTMKTLQIFSSIHAQVHNHFNQERHLVNRSTATFTTTDAQRRSPSGALSPPNRRLGLGKLRNPQAACRYSDIATQPPCGERVESGIRPPLGRRDEGDAHDAVVSPYLARSPHASFASEAAHHEIELQGDRG
jgi:hypothetical protein